MDSQIYMLFSIPIDDVDKMVSNNEVNNVKQVMKNNKKKIKPQQKHLMILNDC